MLRHHHQERTLSANGYGRDIVAKVLTYLPWMWKRSSVQNGKKRDDHDAVTFNELASHSSWMSITHPCCCYHWPRQTGLLSGLSTSAHTDNTNDNVCAKLDNSLYENVLAKQMLWTCKRLLSYMSPPPSRRALDHWAFTEQGNNPLLFLSGNEASDFDIVRFNVRVSVSMCFTKVLYNPYWIWKTPK